jgi:hypothetical protein
MIMIDQKIIYLGTFKDPTLAAKMYDVALIQARGLEAKTNFNYSKHELLAMLFEPSFYTR